MQYKLNDSVISDIFATDLIHDLAMFPTDENDLNLTISDREEKYINELRTNKELTILNIGILSIY